MAFSSGLGDGADNMRYPPQSPDRDSSFSTYTSSNLRGIGTQMHTQTSQPSTMADPRASLHRRFTTNTITTLPTLSSLSLSPLSPIGQQRRQAAEHIDVLSSAFNTKIQAFDKKKAEQAFLREQRRRFQSEMDFFDRQSGQDDDMFRQQDSEFGTLLGPQSEPTTPPELRESNGFASYSRGTRYSLSGSSMSSALGFGTPFSSMATRSGSQAFIPPQTQSMMSHNPSKSVPGSRRNSEEEDEVEHELPMLNAHSGTKT
ncbi:hypothetical protein P152DRAFT_72111 [Eremomyces bilateralis CBS 781.70]|uniref:Uncharacterized protein n=1 Tax=Eremomyces bilateralis CBS 781.70 TaxID=1392243 RepID=A0A6G1FYJ1_9PEZI|nr:uncharacterized protein P152DRAFT_72111 [Eremomyces bilateralis CBS 781.70]KAF1810935.1 hypothetical protein P152DRAFT_72111 [Eremomyces bilateralis CBS 781.70]